MTKALKSYFELYAESHSNPQNKLLHLICVPPILYSIVALVASVPMPASLQISPFVNLASVLAALVLGFYLRHSVKYFAIMFVAILASFALWWAMKSAFPESHVYINLAIFIVAWIGQFIGHKLEGKRPSFFHDLFFLLIGPLWVIRWCEEKLTNPSKTSKV